MMNKDDLQNLLNEMDPAERDLMIKADDAFDALCSYWLSKMYGVEVVCNPEGDRTKIAIDGVVMDQAEFRRWLEDRNTLRGTRVKAEREPVEEESLQVNPTHVPYITEDGYLDAAFMRLYIEAYVRAMSGRYLAKDTTLTWRTDDTKREYVALGVAYGRKMSSEESERARERLANIVNTLSNGHH